MNEPQLFNGDALDVLRSLPPNSADALITDPPYSSGGQFRGDRVVSVRAKYQNTETKKEYPEFFGDARDQRSYFYWVSLWLGQCARIVKNGGPFAIFTDWRQLSTTVDAVQVAGLVYRGIVPWNKTSPPGHLGDVSAPNANTSCGDRLGRWKSKPRNFYPDFSPIGSILPRKNTSPKSL